MALYLLPDPCMEMVSITSRSRVHFCLPLKFACSVPGYRPAGAQASQVLLPQCASTLQLERRPATADALGRQT
jgi:hypothetical protein